MSKVIFLSQFSAMMEEFISYRCSIGYKRVSYEPALKALDKFIAAYFPDEQTLTQDIVMTWIEHTNTESKVRIIRMFAEYLVYTGTAAYILPKKFIGSKQKSTPYILSDYELKRLFLCIDKQSSVQGIYPTAYSVMYRLIYTCGLRPNEGRMLLRKNVMDETGEILVTETKSNKERTVVMSGDMNSYMKQYLVNWESTHGDNPYLFPYGDRCMSAKHIQYFFKECWIKANPDIADNILPKIRVYDLRHRFAAENIMRWTEHRDNIPMLLPYLKQYMGHANLSQTEYYVHLMPERLSTGTNLHWHMLDKLIPEAEE